MEPSDASFLRSYHFLDEHGEPIDIDLDLGGSTVGPSSVLSGGSTHRSRHTRHKSHSKQPPSQHVDIYGDYDAVDAAATTTSNLDDFLEQENDNPDPISAAIVARQNTLKSSHSKRHRRHRSKQLSAMSRWSQNTLVQSVLLADGLVIHDDNDDDDNDDYDEERRLYPEQEIPGRYDKASVKSKITWFGVLCLTGVGMFVEAYVIITTGQVKTVWHDNYPTCWDMDNDQSCPQNIDCCGLFPNTPDDLDVCGLSSTNSTTFNHTLSSSDICTPDQGEYPSHMLCTSQQLGGVSYAEFAGIMAGMLAFGTIADRIGRQKAGTLTALLMIVGIGGMTFFDSDNIRTLFLVFAIFFATFGLGVGGEYPLTATQAAEYHGESKENALLDDQEQRHQPILMETAKTARRGETIALVFAMQGIGAVVGSIFLLSLIYFSNQTKAHCDLASSNSRGTDPNALEGIWRSFYFIGLIFVCMLFIYRSLVLEGMFLYCGVA